MASKQQPSTEQTADLQTALWVWSRALALALHPGQETNRSAGLQSFTEVDRPLNTVIELPRRRSDLFSASSLAALSVMGGWIGRVVVVSLPGWLAVASGGRQLLFEHGVAAHVHQRLLAVAA
jgi:hypothetical protein